MTSDPADRAQRAGLRYQKAEQVERDRQSAWADIAAAAVQVDEKTQKLRELRLAKERADAEAKLQEAPKPPARAPRKVKKPA